MPRGSGRASTMPGGEQRLDLGGEQQPVALAASSTAGRCRSGRGPGSAAARCSSHRAKANWPRSCSNIASCGPPSRCGMSSVSQWVRKRWPFGLQLGPHLGVVEQLAVEDDGDGAVLVADRLPAVGQADDAQPAVGQRQAGLFEEAVLVGAAVDDGVGHAPGRRPRGTGRRCPDRSMIPAMPHMLSSSSVSVDSLSSRVRCRRGCNLRPTVLSAGRRTACRTLRAISRVDQPREAAVDPQHPAGLAADDRLGPVASQAARGWRRPPSRAACPCRTRSSSCPSLRSRCLLQPGRCVSPGTIEQHVDVEAGQLAAQRLGQAAQGELAGRVLASRPASPRRPHIEATLTMAGCRPCVRIGMAERISSAGAKKLTSMTCRRIVLGAGRRSGRSCRRRRC